MIGTNKVKKINSVGLDDMIQGIEQWRTEDHD